VNRTTRPLSYILQSGDQVEVLTSNKQQPEPEWLEIAVTAKAKDAIKKYFRKANERLNGEMVKRLNGEEVEAKAKIAKLQITGEDSFGVMMRIMNIICDHKANMRELHVTTDGKLFRAEAEMVVFKQKVLSQMCMKLRAIESVHSVESKVEE
jgi:(p)ppGpp synthase/HD superfamily hydrolase